MRSRKLLALSSLCIALPPLALCIGDGSTVIPLGLAVLNGGATAFNSLDPEALDPGGSEVRGDVQNGDHKDRDYTDLTITIENGSASNGQIKNGDQSQASFTAMVKEGGAKFRAQFPSEPMEKGESYEIKLEGLSGDGLGAHIVVLATPSMPALINSVEFEANPFPGFDLTRAHDRERNAIIAMDHAVGVAVLENCDASQRITAIDGVISFVGAPSRSVVDVELQTQAGTPVSSTVSIVGNSFTISGFTAIPSGQSRLIVVQLNNDTGEPGVRLQLTGTFEP